MDEIEMRLQILRELRNPSDAMVKVGCELQDVGDETLYPEDFVLKWQAAIDVAIAETTAAVTIKAPIKA